MNINALESDGKILEKNVIPLKPKGLQSSCKFEYRFCSCQRCDVRSLIFLRCTFVKKNLTNKHFVGNVLQDAMEEVRDPTDDIGEVTNLIHRHFLQGYQRYVESLRQSCDILLYHGYNPLWFRFSSSRLKSWRLTANDELRRAVQLAPYTL